MKKTAKRVRALVCLCLAALLITAAFPFTASAEPAEEYMDVFLFLRDEPISQEEKDDFYREMYDYSIGLAFDMNKALNEQDSIVSEIDLQGADLTGWNFWIYTDSSDDDELSKVGTYPADVVVNNDIAEEELDKLIAAQNDDPYSEPYVNIVLEPVIDRKYWFEKQPTAEKPSVVTNKEAESYQWYEYKNNGAKAVVDEGELTDPATQVEITNQWEGSYLGDGKWEVADDSAIDLAVEIGKYDILTVTILTEDFDGMVSEYAGVDFTKEGNTYTYSSPKDNTSFNFWIHGASVSFEAEISLTDIEFDENGAISGQTYTTYTGDPLKLVACHASFENGKYVITSDLVGLGKYWIVKQPTTDAPTVAINDPEDAEAYQWYSYILEEKTHTYVAADTVTDPEKELALKVVDPDNGILDPDEFADSAAGVYVGNGWWKTIVSDDIAGFVAVLSVNGGDKIRFELEDPSVQGSEVNLEDYAFEITATNDLISGAASPLFLDKDGIITVPEGAKLLMVSLFETSDDSTRNTAETGSLSVRLTRTTTKEILEKIEGQTSATFTGEDGTYIVKINTKDETVLTSDPVVIKNPTIPDNGKDDSIAPGDPIPDAGDTSSAVLWAVIGLLCAAAMVATVILRKKANN